MMPSSAFNTSSAVAFVSPMSRFATVKTQFIVVKIFSSCFKCHHCFTITSPTIFLTKNTYRRYCLTRLMLLTISFRCEPRSFPSSFARVYLMSTQSFPIFVDKGRHGPILPSVICTYKIRLHLWQFIHGCHDKPLQHISFAQRQQGIIVLTQRLVKMSEDDIPCTAWFPERKILYRPAPFRSSPYQ